MSKGVRLSETWFNRGLWIIALIFAGFLIGLGSLVVGDLPQVEQQLSQERYLDQKAIQPIRSEIAAKDKQVEVKNAELERLRLQAESANKNFTQTKSSFDNWVETRKATGLSNQDPELISRTKELDSLNAKQIELNKQIGVLDQDVLALRQSRDAIGAKEQSLLNAAQEKLDAQLRKQELRVFLYRLLITLPLIAIAGWLFVKHRKSRQWPFIWGFIFFALFTFFVELVPYLPSYGGYVRYIVGIILTVIIGRYVINALQAYLERQKQEEQKPDTKRREELNYDLALTRMAKKVCPGCERPISLEDPERNYCTHCGLCVFDHCHGCTTRKSAFARFCQSCGLAPKREETPAVAATSSP
jgi:hypothetical protein